MANPQIELTLLNERLNEILRTFVATMRTEILALQAGQIPAEQIAANLTAQFVNGTGSLGAVKNAIARIPTNTARQIYTEAQTRAITGIANRAPAPTILPRREGYSITVSPDGETITYTPASREPEISEIRERGLASQRETTRMMWVAVYRNTCIDCINLSGQVKTLQEWRTSGYWPGNGHTRCGGRCHCHLVPVGVLADRFAVDGDEEAQEQQLQDRLKNGVQLQKRKIEEIEKIRGEKYAESTYQQKLGQVRTEFFNPGNEGRESLFIKREPKGLGKRFNEKVEEAYGE